MIAKWTLRFALLLLNPIAWGASVFVVVRAPLKYPSAWPIFVAVVCLLCLVVGGLTAVGFDVTEDM